MDNGTRRPARQPTTPFLFDTRVSAFMPGSADREYTVSFSLSPRTSSVFHPSPLRSISVTHFPETFRSPHVCLTSFLREVHPPSLPGRVACFPTRQRGKQFSPLRETRAKEGWALLLVQPWAQHRLCKLYEPSISRLMTRTAATPLRVINEASRRRTRYLADNSYVASCIF